MTRQKVTGSYLVRFTETQLEQSIRLHDLKTGKCVEFETWVSAWAFLERENRRTFFAERSVGDKG